MKECILHALQVQINLAVELVRFIAVNEGYDSGQRLGSSVSLDVSLKAGHSWRVAGDRMCWTRENVRRALCDERYTCRLISHTRAKEDVSAKILSGTLRSEMRGCLLEFDWRASQILQSRE